MRLAFIRPPSPRLADLEKNGEGFLPPCYSSAACVRLRRVTGDRVRLRRRSRRVAAAVVGTALGPPADAGRAARPRRAGEIPLRKAAVSRAFHIHGREAGRTTGEG